MNDSLEKRIDLEISSLGYCTSEKSWKYEIRSTKLGTRADAIGMGVTIGNKSKTNPDDPISNDQHPVLPLFLFWKSEHLCFKYFLNFGFRYSNCVEAIGLQEVTVYGGILNNNENFSNSFSRLGLISS